MAKNMTYAGAGVDYGDLDKFKREAQKEAAETDICVARFGFSVVSWTRGESVFLLETPLGYMALVVEGLGTKNLVADDLYRLAKKMESITGKSFYEEVGQCNVAMAVNDMITLGAMPVLYGQYLAVGNSNWFKNKLRYSDLIKGTKKACLLAGCVWGNGETAALKDLIPLGMADLAGATVGLIMDKSQLIDPKNIRHDDAIVFIESSGIHANGLTMAREIAGKLSDGYLTKLDDGRMYGETLLDPTHIYVGLVEDCIKKGVSIHYAVNITGHGWRKLMRAPQLFTYIIDDLPWQQPIFKFLQKYGPIDDREAYGNLNMGAGFALYVPEDDVDLVLQIAISHEFRALCAGYIKRSKKKKVVIKPLGLEYKGETLGVR